ncbi:hypothetical protein [Jeotgalibacillus soli]|uniref:Uncharacterized protein n=1 Tax=Jeotgalibacillus soli TaxID=889306 RepID=A0A0C2V9K2_9BACL|nr:hypothetical protein [Jeotgalibacillus soli]KIL45632.1 hypothetical protein KP78_19810 [Jeotgalibacillus soli]
MNGLPLNETFITILEWGFVVVATAVFIFSIWSIKYAPKMKGAFLWRGAHLLFMIGANFLFWMGIRDQSASTTPIDSLVDQVQFLMG